jgi:hypothetical protein
MPEQLRITAPNAKMPSWSLVRVLETSTRPIEDVAVRRGRMRSLRLLNFPSETTFLGAELPPDRRTATKPLSN